MQTIKTKKLKTGEKLIGFNICITTPNNSCIIKELLAWKEFAESRSCQTNKIRSYFTPITISEG